MVQQTARRGDQNRNALHQLRGLALPIRAAHHDAVRQSVRRRQVRHDAEDLHRQFARRRDDNRARALSLLPFQTRQQLDHRDHERQRLTGACSTREGERAMQLGRSENVLAGEKHGNRFGLDRGHRLEVLLGEHFLRFFYLWKEKRICTAQIERLKSKVGEEIGIFTLGYS